MESADLKTLFHECMPLFVALGDELRLTIVESLAEEALKCKAGNTSSESLCQYGLNVREITEKTNLSRPAISHHLKLLKDAGIVEMRREKTSNYYYLTISQSTKMLMKLGTELRTLFHVTESLP